MVVIKELVDLGLTNFLSLNKTMTTLTQLQCVFTKVELITLLLPHFPKGTTEEDVLGMYLSPRDNLTITISSKQETPPSEITGK